jgi:hypothetical protein
MLEGLSNELEQMLIDADRQTETNSFTYDTDYGTNDDASNPEQANSAEQAQSERESRSQRLSRSPESNEIVVDDPDLIPRSDSANIMPNSTSKGDRPATSPPTPSQHRQSAAEFVPLTNQAIPNQQNPATVNRANQANHNNQDLSPIMGGTHVAKLAEHEPVPLPSLEIADRELVAGVPISVRVKLAAIAPQLVVKIWVKDCQSRSLVDGPRWLFDFSPIADGSEVASQTQITLPLGSMEVAFEAIAVEMLTQRESHKTRVTRSVAPPNMEQHSALDFDLP